MQSVSHHSQWASADLYYLSELNPTNVDRTGTRVAAQGQQEGTNKNGSFFCWKTWMGGGEPWEKRSRNELPDIRSAAGSLRAELKHHKVLGFISSRFHLRCSWGSFCGHIMLHSQHLFVLLCCLPLAGMLDNTHKYFLTPFSTKYLKQRKKENVGRVYRV